MIHKPLARRWTISLGILGILLLAGFYSWLSFRQHQKNPTDRTLPTWTQLGEGVRDACKARADGDSTEIYIWDDFRATYYRLFSGLFVGVALSIVIGLFMGCYSPVEALLVPPLSFLAKIPPTAMIAVFFVTVGIEHKMYVTMIAFGVFPTLAQNVYLAAKNQVPDELVYKASTLGASQAETIWNVVYKQILPDVLDGIRLQIGPAMVYLIAAEWMVGDVGFGYRIKMQYRLVDMRIVYVYLVFLGFSGFLIDWVLINTRRRLCPWYSD